jgi:hypothetical protein
MQRYQTIRLAKLPCTSRVAEGGRKLKCNDVYRVVTVDEHERVCSIKCLSHGHKSRGKQRELLNPMWGQRWKN